MKYSYQNTEIVYGICIAGGLTGGHKSVTLSGVGVCKRSGREVLKMGLLKWQGDLLMKPFFQHRYWAFVLVAGDHRIRIDQLIMIYLQFTAQHGAGLAGFDLLGAEVAHMNALEFAFHHCL